MSTTLARKLASGWQYFQEQWPGREQAWGRSPSSNDEERLREQHRYLDYWAALVYAVEQEDYTNLDNLSHDLGREEARLGVVIEDLVRHTWLFIDSIWDCVEQECTRKEEVATLLKEFDALRRRILFTISDGYGAEQKERIARHPGVAATANGIKPLPFSGGFLTPNPDAYTALRHIAATSKAFRHLSYRKRQSIFSPGDSNGVFYFIIEGRVHLHQILRDGRSVTLSILEVGDVFTQYGNGLSPFHAAYADAWEDTKLAMIHEKDFDYLMHTSPVLAAQVISSFYQQLSELQLWIDKLLGRDASLRLAHILLKLGSKFGTEEEPGRISLDLPLTHQELADMIGSNRVTVTKKLEEMRSDNVIETKNRNLMILNRAALEEMLS